MITEQSLGSEWAARAVERKRTKNLCNRIVDLTSFARNIVLWIAIANAACLLVFILWAVIHDTQKLCQRKA
jgi:hypothetical protein